MVSKHKKLNIALTGLMGSGKSTVGKYLADTLGMQFIDTDSLIEEKEKKSITEIFAEKGEAYFRKLEKDLIQDLLNQDGQVISLGGGLIIDDENRNLVRRKAQLIALIAEPRDLYNRIKRRNNRPLINQSKDPLKELESLWESRKPAYMDSHMQIETGSKSVNAICLEIIRKLGLNKTPGSQLTVQIPRTNFSYKIVFDELKNINLKQLNLGKKILIISQEPIAKHYLSTVKEKLELDFDVHVIIIDDGEESKNFFTYQLILQKLLALKFERKDSIIALGGGVVGDIAGFAASTYYRGINYIQIPTTLLSMIDSSVGGKTAVNVPEGKNLIGTFYQPHLVHIDSKNLQTLSDKEYKSGLGELVKYTLLGNKWDYLLGDSFFDFVNSHTEAIINKDKIILNEIINHCLKIKSGIVSEDEVDTGIRSYLNLGHTFGHALEEVTKYKYYSHGEAVAIGLACACYLSRELNYLSTEQIRSIIQLMENLGLNHQIPEKISTKSIIEAFKYDKKSERGKVKFIIPKSNIGKVEIIENINMDLVRKAIDLTRA